MTKLLLNYIIIVFILILLCFVSFLVGRACSKQQRLENTNFFKLSNTTGVSGNKYLFDAEIRSKAKQLFKLNSIDYSNIENLNDATYLIRAYAKKNEGVDYQCFYDGKLRYIYHEIHFKDEQGQVGPPVGYVMIYSNGKVVSKLYNHKIQVHTMISKKEDIYQVVNSADYILLQSGLASRKDSNKKDWKNVVFNLPIENAEIYINAQKNENKKIVFDFQPDLSLNGGVILTDGTFDWLPSIGFSLFKYGTPDNVDWRFLRFGVGLRDLDDGINYNFSPGFYNLHKVVTIIDNTYIGPFVGYDNRKINVGVNLALTF